MFDDYGTSFVTIYVHRPQRYRLGLRADDPDRWLRPKRHQGGPWDRYLRAWLPVGCARYGASQRHRCRRLLDRDLDADRRALRIDGRRHLPHVTGGRDTAV